MRGRGTHRASKRRMRAHETNPFWLRRINVTRHERQDHDESERHESELEDVRTQAVDVVDVVQQRSEPLP